MNEKLNSYLERGAHARALGVAEAIDFRRRNLRLIHGRFEERQHVLEVVLGCFAGEKALPRRRDVGVTRIREDGAIQRHHSDGDFVGGTLEPYRY